MSIGAVSGSYSSASAQSLQRLPEAAEVKGGPDNDNDADDGVKAAAAAPAPTVNLNGQQLGQLINVTA